MDSKALKVLVVGGAGYIGSHVTKALIQAGHSPIVFDNLSSGLRQNLLPGVPFVYGNVLIPDQIRETLTEPMDAIIHLAALKAAGESMLKPEKYAVQNMTGTLNLLNAALEAGIDKFIFSSTAAVYGTPEYTPLDEAHPTRPTNFYGYTKLEIEALLKWYDQLKGLKYASLRYFNAAGYDVDGELRGLEQSPNNLLPIVMETIFGKRPYLEIFGDDYDTPDGSCIRDYIHVSDLAAGHVKALGYLMEQKQSLTVNLGTSKGLSVFEVVKVAKELSGVDFKVKVVEKRPGDPAVVLSTYEKANKLLGWAPKHSDVKTLIKTMLAVYQAQRG
ncbi:UDP-glucose 4-epimerase GalE [Deltaproteobacteria bacterium TL4]